VHNMETPILRSGATAEDIMLELLRPMLKDWMEANLAQTVERLVEQEISKMATAV